MKSIAIIKFAVLLLLIPLADLAAENRQLFWGDTHLHTTYSFDAFLNNNLTADPDTAYRFAKGQPIIHPYHRARMQLDAPLDFLVVSDHAEFLGQIREIYHNGVQDEDAGILDRIIGWYATRTLREAIDAREGAALFRDLLPVAGDPRAAARASGDVGGTRIPLDPEVERSAWAELVASAEAHNEPGRFTTLLGWEWSSIPAGANLHRVVVTDADGDQGRSFQPFSSAQSPYPDDLWRWLDETSAATGARFLAIPHNANISKGLMFSDTTLRGDAVDADYARLRMRWERLVEVTQIKGDSEAAALLSPEDEFAGFENYPFYIQQDVQDYEARPGDYVRSALRTGLQLGAAVGVNPFQFGLIGSTDSHTGLSTADENNFGGKMATDSIPETKQGQVIAGRVRGWAMSASGLAAVWAEENTRSGIIDAMHRRETYATTGPRMRVRFFGGWNLSDADLQSADWIAAGYAKGVPMGGELDNPAKGAELPAEAVGVASTDRSDDLAGQNRGTNDQNQAGNDSAAGVAEAPSFLVVANKDPNGANLDRVQIVKGWLDADGESHERVFDVAWSGDRQPDKNGKLAAVGNTVDLTTARYSNSIGAAELATLWRDPEFDAAQPAFYYVRVIEIPTPRHALYDALALGMEAPNYGPSVIQERAYTSPIWYRP